MGKQLALDIVQSAAVVAGNGIGKPFGFLDAGQGIATGLLRHAFARCVAGAELIGGRALMVHAVDADAALFSRRWDFLPSKDDPLVLFRSIAEIAASFTVLQLRSVLVPGMKSQMALI